MSIDKSIFPNMLTFANLLSGVFSVILAFRGDFLWAGIFILLAALADRYDGKVARALNVTNPIGKELDSFADLVSFGIAPSILACQFYGLFESGLWGYVLVSFFPVAAAYRLARFNVTDFDGEFYGIPTTFAGLFMAVYLIMGVYIAIPVWLTAVLLVLLSYLMVCTHRFKKF